MPTTNQWGDVSVETFDPIKAGDKPVDSGSPIEWGDVLASKSDLSSGGYEPKETRTPQSPYLSLGYGSEFPDAGGSSLPEVAQAIQTPFLTLPEGAGRLLAPIGELLPKPIGEAIQGKAKEFVEGSTSPLSIAAAALPMTGLPGKALMGIYGMLTAPMAVKGAQEVGEAIAEKDTKKLTEGLIDVAAGVAPVAGEVASGIGGKTPPIIPVKSTSLTPLTDAVLGALKQSTQPSPPIIGMGGAVPSEFTGRPTIEDILSPEIRAALPDKATAVPELPSVLTRLSEAFTSAKEAFPGWLGGLAGETLPKITRQNRELGELGARWISSTEAARPMATIYAHDVFSGLKVDQAKFDAALKADNLLSIRDGFQERADWLRKEGNEEAAASEQAHADSVNTLLGSKDFPFKSESELQAFFNEPEVSEAVRRHVDNWNQIVEPMYKRSLDIDPSEELPSRGKYSGARINLNPVVEGESVPAGKRVGKGGNLLGTMRRKDPFARKAYGTGQEYVLNYPETIANTLEKRMEIANKKEFEDHMVQSGNAVVADVGKPVSLPDGGETVAYPLLRKGFVNKNIYVRKSLAKEYEIAANVNLNPYRGTVIKTVADAVNKAALTGLTDATVHVGNLSTALFQAPGVAGHPLIDSLLSAAFRADVPVIMVKAGIKGLPNIADHPLWKNTLSKYMPKAIVEAVNTAWLKNQTQLAALAQIGAARGSSHGNLMGRTIMGADKLTRGMLDDTYKNLVRLGLVKASETGRREFINQVGQYNMRAQGPFTRFLRQTGIAPFVTAGKSFNVLGARGAVMIPGVEASSLGAAALLRANMIAKWIGTVVLIRTLNQIVSGDPNGRKGVPFGSVDNGGTDENGRPTHFPVMLPLGQARALRVVGARGLIEAKRLGLDTPTATDSAARDVAMSAISPFMGPLPRMAAIATTGSSMPGMNVPRASEVVPPGDNQTIANSKAALLEANPVVASIHDLMKPGGGTSEALRRQLPRFTLQGGKPEALADNYPKIVERAKASAYLDDVIHRSRYMSQEERSKYIREALTRIPQDYQAHAKMVLKIRKVKY